MYNFINNMHGKPRFNINRLPISITTPKPEPLRPQFNAKTVSLFSQPYLDKYSQCYKNIVVVSHMPKGPLSELVRLVQFPPLSEFKQPGPCSPYKTCGYALLSLDYRGCSGFSNYGYSKCSNDLMVVDEVPTLISFLLENGYSVDTSITKMFYQSDIRFDTNTGNKLICFVTYNL